MSDHEEPQELCADSSSPDQSPSPVPTTERPEEAPDKDKEEEDEEERKRKAKEKKEERMRKLRELHMRRVSECGNAVYCTNVYQKTGFGGTHIYYV